MINTKQCPNCCRHVVQPTKFPNFGTYVCPSCEAALTTDLLPSVVLTAAVLGVNQCLVYFNAPTPIVMASYLLLVLRCLFMNKIDAVIFPLKVAE